MNKRVKKYIAKALEVSLESDYKRVQIGTIIVDGKRVVATGSNTQRSHPVQAHYNSVGGRTSPSHYLHSELHALLRSGARSLRSAEMFIGRFERNGNLGNCRPCPACEAAIKAYGVKRIYYTDNDGIKELKL